MMGERDHGEPGSIAGLADQQAARARIEELHRTALRQGMDWPVEPQAAMAADPTSPYDLAFGRLDTQADYLLTLVTQLGERFKDAMRPSQPTEAVGDRKPAPGSSTNVIALDSLADRIDGQLARLDDMIRRCEL